MCTATKLDNYTRYIPSWGVKIKNPFLDVSFALGKMWFFCKIESSKMNLRQDGVVFQRSILLKCVVKYHHPPTSHGLLGAAVLVLSCDMTMFMDVSYIPKLGKNHYSHATLFQDHPYSPDKTTLGHSRKRQMSTMLWACLAWRASRKMVATGRWVYQWGKTPNKHMNELRKWG